MVPAPYSAMTVVPFAKAIGFAMPSMGNRLSSAIAAQRERDCMDVLRDRRARRRADARRPYRRYGEVTRSEVAAAYRSVVKAAPAYPTAPRPSLRERPWPSGAIRAGKP